MRGISIKDRVATYKSLPWRKIFAVTFAVMVLLGLGWALVVRGGLHEPGEVMVQALLVINAAFQLLGAWRPTWRADFTAWEARRRGPLIRPGDE